MGLVWSYLNFSLIKKRGPLSFTSRMAYSQSNPQSDCLSQGIWFSPHMLFKTLVGFQRKCKEKHPHHASVQE